MIQRQHVREYVEPSRPAAIVVPGKRNGMINRSLMEFVSTCCTGITRTFRLYYREPGQGDPQRHDRGFQSMASSSTCEARHHSQSCEHVAQRKLTVRLLSFR